MTPSYRYRAVGFVIGFAVGASILATTGIRYLPIPGGHHRLVRGQALRQAAHRAVDPQ
jgi:hypothetical protein